MNRHDFVQAMQRARRGGRVTYHIGLLMNDRLADPELDKLARTAYGLAMVEKAALIQRRVPDAIPSACEYIAVRL